MSVVLSLLYRLFSLRPGRFRYDHGDFSQGGLRSNLCLQR